MKTVIHDRSLSSVYLCSRADCHITTESHCGGVVWTDWAGHSWPLYSPLYRCTVLYCVGCHTVTSTMRSWHNYMIKPKYEEPADILKARLLAFNVQSPNQEISHLCNFLPGISFDIPSHSSEEDWRNGWKFILFIIRTSCFVIYDRLTNSTPVHFWGGTH